MTGQNVKPPPARPVVVGTGLVALDVVIADGLKNRPILCAGGTCGNVLTSLAFLGWESYPIARLGCDAASKCVLEDLQRWGVNLDFISLSECGSTPVVVQHIRRNEDGGRSHKFSRKCPSCGAWLPWYKAVKATAVSDLSPRLPKADVFYFDRTSRGAIKFAQHARAAGAIVLFEPSSESDPTLMADALTVAHVVKIASDRLRGNEDILKAKTPTLLIETLGSQGLRFKQASRRLPWVTLPAFRVSDLRDTAGAGDWCTVGIISSIGTFGPQKLAQLTPEELSIALLRGQAMGSWACQYDGARGGMYVSTKSDFDQAICDILNGKVRTLGRLSTSAYHSKGKAVWCGCAFSNG